MPNIKDFKNDKRFASGLKLVLNDARIFAGWDAAANYGAVNKPTYEAATFIDIYAHQLFGRIWLHNWTDIVFVRRDDGVILFSELTNFNESNGYNMMYNLGVGI